MAGRPRGSPLQRAAQFLFPLNGFDQGLEIAFAKRTGVVLLFRLSVQWGRWLALIVPFRQPLVSILPKKTIPMFF